MYSDGLAASLHLWNDRYARNLINAFRELQEEGVLEIITGLLESDLAELPPARRERGDPCHREHEQQREQRLHGVGVTAVQAV